MNNISFTGINISNTSVLNHKLSIFKLTEIDKPFINRLGNTVDLKKLYPQISKDEFTIYDFILKRAIENAKDSGKQSLLLSSDGIPCGIMANKHKNTTHYVDYITTWAVEPNKKTPFGAQILFTQMFRDFLKTGANFIELYAIKFGNAISKYRKIGFKSYGGDNYTEIMRIKREEVEKSYNKLQEKFNLTQADSSEDLNLFDILKIR